MAAAGIDGCNSTWCHCSDALCSLCSDMQVVQKHRCNGCTGSPGKWPPPGRTAAATLEPPGRPQAPPSAAAAGARGPAGAPPPLPLPAAGALQPWPAAAPTLAHPQRPAPAAGRLRPAPVRLLRGLIWRWGSQRLEMALAAGISPRHGCALHVTPRHACIIRSELNCLIPT